MSISKINSIFLMLFAAVFIIACGSASKKANWYDPSITNQEDCREDVQQYWYKNKCWNDFSISDGYIAPEEIEEVAALFTKLLEDAYVSIDGTLIKTFTPFFDFNYENSTAVSIQVFEWNEDTHSMLSLLPLIDGNLEYYTPLATTMTFVRGNLLNQNEEITDDNVVSKGEGTLYGEPVKLDYDDISSNDIDIKGTLYNGMNYEAFFTSQLLYIGDSTLTIEGDRAILSGTLGALAYLQVRSLRQHPEVKILVLQDVPESIMDEINIYTGRLIHTLGLTTFVPYNSTVSSGAVDLFAAGKERIVERGGVLGIHSWASNEYPIAIADYPDEHPVHMIRLDYFTEILGKKLGPDFYFRTIQAAPADDMHYMTEDEMLSTQIATKIIERGDSLD